MQADNDNSDRAAPGVLKNRHGGYQLHIKLGERHASPIIGGGVKPNELAPAKAQTLSVMAVFEDVVQFEFESGQSLLVKVTDAEVAGSVVFFYHANGVLWRAVALEELNPGWVVSSYRFRGDLGKFEARLVRMRTKFGRPRIKQKTTSFWQTGDWPGGVVCTATNLVYQVKQWQHSDLPKIEVELPQAEQVETLSDPHPADVQQIVALQAEGVEKRSYQVGGLNLVLKYVGGIGLVEIVNRYCPREPRLGGIPEGVVITVLVINRLLAPCALSNVSDWLKQSGLHLLLGIADPDKFNYDRLVDALLAVHDHWHDIAAEVTLRAVETFGLKVETVHYDLTSILFHGAYEGSAWVDFGYSRDHRPDKPQINLGLSATADGEVVLPGGSDLHPGHTNDGTTTVGTHQQLRTLFQRTDILITGDRIMHNAENMLTIARAHGRFLGPTDWTPDIRRIVTAILEEEFKTLPLNTAKAGHSIKATLRRLNFKVKEKMSEPERQRQAHWRKKRGVRGRTPKYRSVHFWMRATIILNTAHQQADAARRQGRLKAYQTELDLIGNRLNKGRYYNDPEWLAGRLADLAAEFKDVRQFVKVIFSQHDEVMSLTYHLCQAKIDQAAQLDGKWVLVTNQPPDPAQTKLDYMDWMLGVYKNHRHIERRMRNLKSDLPIRPIFAHRDEVIVALCFVCVLSLMLYTLIERACQAHPALLEVGLTTTDRLFNALSGFCLTVFFTPSGYQLFWFDTPTYTQTLLWQQLDIPIPGSSAPIVRPADQDGSYMAIPLLLLIQKGLVGETMALYPSLPSLLHSRLDTGQSPYLPFFAIVKVLIVMLC
jgi:transposase